MDNDVVEYVLDALLIFMVVFQLRGRSLSIRQLMVPIAIVTYFAIDYLKTFPTAGNDLIMEVAGALFGAGLGLGCGAATRVGLRADGVPVARATGAAAALWLFGMCGRLFFQVWVEHGGGAATVGAFSAANDLTSGAAWADCLVLMALAEVLGRTAVIASKGFRLPGGIPVSARASAVAGAVER